MFLGFVQRWNFIRLLNRFFLGAMLLLSPISIFIYATNDALRRKIPLIAIPILVIQLIVVVWVFFYLGTEKIKALFKRKESRSVEN